MLGIKVQQILVENRHTGKKPRSMTALAASLGISERTLYRIFENPKPQDTERVAKGLGISVNQLSP